MEFRFMTKHMPLPPGMWFPAVLMELRISSTAKIMYCRMLDAALADGMPDDAGMLFVHYPIAELARDISRCSMTVKRSLNELENAGLVMRVRQKAGMPNRIYVLVPEKEKQDGTDNLYLKKQECIVPGQEAGNEIHKK